MARPPEPETNRSSSQVAAKSNDPRAFPAESRIEMKHSKLTTDGVDAMEMSTPSLIPASRF
jgi:hypothetical protein